MPWGEGDAAHCEGRMDVVQLISEGGDEGAPRPTVPLSFWDESLASAVGRLTEAPTPSTSTVVETLKDIAAILGLAHIAYLCLDPNMSPDGAMLSAVTTFPVAWERRYFARRYFEIDPVIAKGRVALLPFDWRDLAIDDPNVLSFLAAAVEHGAGRYGLSVPVRRRPDARSLVSYTADITASEWERFKADKMAQLQHLSQIISAAARAAVRTTKLPPAKIALSVSEEQCVIWSARGKTHQEIAKIVSFSPSRVRMHLDTARHKLGCVNVTHLVAVAIAKGVIPPAVLRDGP